MDMLTASNFEDALLLKRKSEESSKKDWDKKNRMVCSVIRFYLIQDINYHVMIENLEKKIWEILEGKYLTKRIENHFPLKRRLYRFQLKKNISIGEYMNNYTKLLTDLSNVDEMIKDEDKALILLSSLPNEDYGTFVLILIKGKQSFSYNDVSSALVNHELRKKIKSPPIVHR